MNILSVLQVKNVTTATNLNSNQGYYFCDLDRPRYVEGRRIYCCIFYRTAAAETRGEVRSNQMQNTNSA